MRSTLKVSLLLFSLTLGVVRSSPGFFSSSAPEPVIDSKWDPNKVYEPGTPKPATAELAACVTTAAGKLGIDLNMKTDPALLKEILTNVMHLDTMPEVQQMFEADLKTPQPLAPMFEQVKTGLTQQHPAVGVVICASLDHPKAKAIYTGLNATAITRTIHNMYLLNKLVTRASMESSFMDALKVHLDKQVETLVGTSSRWMRAWRLYNAAGIFGAVKDYSIELGIQGMKNLRDNGAKKENVEGWASGLTINILEATATDLMHGYMDNVWVGKAIAGDKVSSIDISSKKHAVRYGLTTDFARLYETWNLAFITGNLEFLDILYPKLLIPRVILASGQAYIYERVIALWLSIQFFLMADLQKVPHVRFNGQTELATIWGKINYRYYLYLQAQKKK